MRDGGVIARSCAIIDSLIRGAVHDRRTIANAFDVELAAADRYIKLIAKLPGVVSIKLGRRLTIRWSFSDAIKAAGL